MIRTFGVILISFILIACGAESDQSSGGVGHAGSMSRFAIYNNTLYAISESKLLVVNIENRQTPLPQHSIPISFFIETLFVFNDKLLIGAENGMYIYSLSTENYPSFSSMFTHARACDPVVAEGDYAYVTLRSGGRCWGDVNQLHIINISNFAQPFLEFSHYLFAPSGLAIDNNLLFICDGQAGLRTFDVTEKSLLTAAQAAVDKDCYDLIANKGNLIVTEPNGIFQYDYRTLPMTELSQIQALKKKQI
ncbi:MAG: hypothetical protein OEZ58_07785 [Gammaproteobacteria bacterium]|nr:hypothetical protein [Gammaproteobacteria bacterium]